MTVKEFALETLGHRRISRLNFRYGPILIYPAGYSRDVAKLIEDGHILFDTNEGAHYTVDSQPGEHHHMALPKQNIDSPVPTRNAGHLQVLPNLGRIGGAQFRMTVVHESTHALQDYQRNQTDPEMAEGAAYLAGWITCLLWNHPRLEPGVTPTTAHAYARQLAGDFLDSRIGYIIAERAIERLNGMVLTGAASRYVFNGI